MRKNTKIETHERSGPEPGRTFKTWIEHNHVELNVRKVAKEFAEWINAGGLKFDWQDELKKSFLELTQLTVDLITELRQVRGPASAVRFGDGVLYASHSRGDVKRYATVRRYCEKINPILTRVQRHKALTQLRDFPGPDGMPVLHETHYMNEAEHIGRAQTAHAASYALKQFHFLFERRAFAEFRRCALSTCNNYFFPLRTEGRYCSDACQGKDYMRDPLRTKKNAAYQKVNYYTKKVQELAKLAAVNQSYQEKYHHAKKELKSANAKLAALKRRR
jgi:hypothetical protein